MSAHFTFGPASFGFSPASSANSRTPPRKVMSVASDPPLRKSRRFNSFSFSGVVMPPILFVDRSGIKQSSMEKGNCPVKAMLEFTLQRVRLKREPRHKLKLELQRPQPKLRVRMTRRAQARTKSAHDSIARLYNSGPAAQQRH